MSDQTPYGTAYSPPNSTMATVSLISGILGLTFLPFLGSIVALITGYMAKKEIVESRGAVGGDGSAKAGIILGWIGIGLSLCGVCIAGVAILLPLLLVALGISSEGYGLLPVILSII
jgi:hypothetical protein